MDSRHLAKSNILITCSWDLETKDQSILNALTIGSSTVRARLDEIVHLETCVHLINRNEKEQVPCTLHIQLPASTCLQICNLSIVSEAKVVEAYGNKGEYCGTCHGEYVDDFEEMAVFQAEIDITPSSEVTLKFARIKSESSMWLYGMKLGVMNSEPKPFVASSNINFSNIDKRLKESGRPITEKAESCKKFVQLYNSLTNGKTSGCGKPPDPQVIFKLFEGEYLSSLKPLGDRGQSVSKCIANMMPFINEDKTDVPASKTESKAKGDDLSAINLVDLKNHIDVRLGDMEKRLLHRIDERLQQVEARQIANFEKIVSLLQR